MSKSLIDFLNSNFFQTLVTFAAALIALYVYRKQKKDIKKAAANSILLEIQHIEGLIPKIKDAVRSDGLNNLTVNVMREDAWSKYSQLFSRDFDKDEWEGITNFYQTARLLDSAIQRSNQSFKQNTDEIRINRQRIFADLNKDFLDSLQDGVDNEQALIAHNQKMDLFTQLYMQRQGELEYTPAKYQNDAQKYLEDLKVISVTTIGSKFKAII